MSKYFITKKKHYSTPAVRQRKKELKISTVKLSVLFNLTTNHMNDILSGRTGIDDERLQMFKKVLKIDEGS